MLRRTSGALDPFIDPWSPQWSAAIAAAAHARDPEPLLRPLLSQLGFEGLTCIVLAPNAGTRERASSVWSTSASAWAARYRDCGYAAVDPRVALTARCISPIVWDAADAPRDWHARRFIADAARYGTRSGFAVSFGDPLNGRAVISLDSGVSPISEARCAAIVSKLGDLMLLAAALHDRVLRPRFAELRDANRAAGALTQRERQCLRLAANGLTSGDIGGKLGIAERTVNFHMRNVLRKLEALNRSEAIAKALTHGVLPAGAIAQRSV